MIFFECSKIKDFVEQNLHRLSEFLRRFASKGMIYRFDCTNEREVIED